MRRKYFYYDDLINSLLASGELCRLLMIFLNSILDLGQNLQNFCPNLDSKVSEFDQEIPQSHTADQPTAQ